jgi:hypothetical protein
MLRSLRVAMMAEKPKIIFQLDSGAYFSVLPFSLGPQSNDKSYHSGQIWPALEHYFTQLLACTLGDLLFCHSFLIVPKTPMSLLGQNLLSQLKTYILLPPGSYFCCPLLQEQIDSTVWTDEMSVGQARMALPIQIKLKNPSQFPHTKQYPLKPEGQ